MWGRGPRGNNGACSTVYWISVTSTATHKQIGPFWYWSQVGGLVYVLGPCGSLQRTLLWSWEFLLLLPQPPQVFSISGLRLYFSSLEPWVERSVSWSTSHGLTCPGLTCPGPPATPLPRVLSPRLPVAPPTSLDECFFFIFLVVGLPYSLIFCHLWLFFVFKLWLSFFWLCKEAQCVYLCLHLGWKSLNMVFLFQEVLDQKATTWK